MSRSKYHRARIRSFLFTVGPNRLTGGRIARRHLAREIERQEIEVICPEWPEEFDGIRIAHISDFHLGKLITLQRGLEALREVRNAEPDLVACTGDVIDLHHNGEMRHLLRAMADIDAPMGTCLVVGNHDELVCGQRFRRVARDAGLTLLDDQVEAIRRGGQSLLIGGIGWGRSAEACRQKVERTCPDGCHLLLAHNPKAFAAAADVGVSLTLSGHTHGGQVALPGRPNVNLSITHRHSAGMFTRGESQLHVTTGVGSWFPLRMNCPAEVAVITVRCAS